MTSDTAATKVDVDVIVIGAGFAGLYMLHRLRRSGHTARVLEAGRSRTIRLPVHVAEVVNRPTCATSWTDRPGGVRVRRFRCTGG